MHAHPVPTVEIQPGTPWHTGERLLQARIGVEARLAEVGPRVVRDFMPDQHRDFFAMLPSVVIGAVDPEGRPWATVRAGHPGFLHSPDARVLDVALPRDTSDPADAGMEDGDAIGLLGIQPATRRRNRMNGTIRRAGTDAGTRGFRIAVGQSFGNCPQYIQKRDVAFTRDPALPADVPPQVLSGLDAAARQLIRNADSFFVASFVDLAGGQRQVDVSHRGGKPGFVRVDDDGGLTIPDFPGNTFFNTLGNLMVNPVAGLVFVDYASGELLQMSGRAEVLTDSPETARFDGAQVLWRFLPTHMVRREHALPLRWASLVGGESPQALATGSWD